MKKIIETIETLDYQVKGQVNNNEEGAKASLKSHEGSRFIGIGVIFLALYFIVKNTIGFNFLTPSFGIGNSAGITSSIVDGKQIINSKLSSGEYPPIVVQKGIPVKWTLSAEKQDLNGCNNRITIPEYNIEKKLLPGDNVIEFTPSKEGDFVYSCWMGMISSNIKVVSDLNNEKALQTAKNEIEPQGANSDLNLSSIFSGSCCADGAKATKFAGGVIPTEQISLASLKQDEQEVSIKVNDEGYSPAVVVLQKGVKAKIKFVPEKLNSCNYIVSFPDMGGKLNLKSGSGETPYFNPIADFTFECGMGMLHGYVKVVDDINKVDIEAVKNEVENYRAPIGGMGGGCCG